ncbi:hypothetical protein ILUMI_00491 [Ignelater luminosus]|uniref:Uncharacterized protein n=1 Tax=Ignelater luminosus TaxID=2038154 RepID=A0A8K0DK42_IGNLU|nr:hypothetical protein ILUMI_00491 [Ignelater luminosus]
MHFIFSTAFLLFLLLGNHLCNICHHCRLLQKDPACRHPDHYYPPVAFCGATGSHCATVNMSIIEANGSPPITFGDPKVSQWAVFKGCVRPEYCEDLKKLNASKDRALSKVGMMLVNCSSCVEEYCNRGANSILNYFVSMRLFIFLIVIFSIYT